VVKAFTAATVGSPPQVIGIDRSEPETDEATADVDDRVGAFHCTIWITGDVSPPENLSVRVAMTPGAVVDERCLDKYEAVKIIFAPETE
jgi:hypothetical protein